MNNDINLLAKTDVGLQKQKKWEKSLQALAIISLIFVGLSSLIVFLLGRQFSVSVIKTEQENALAQISLLHKKEEKLLVIKNRLKGISDILNKRVDYSKTTNAILKKVPTGVLVDKLAVDSNTVSLSASSDSLLSLNSLIDNLIDMAKRKEAITSLTLNSLSLNEKTSRYVVYLQGVL